MAKSLISAGYIILTVVQICVRGSPVDQRGEVQELDTLKDLIQLLQDQHFDEISDKDLDGNEVYTKRSLQTEEGRPTLVVDPSNRLPADGATLSELRDLSRTARSSNQQFTSSNLPHLIVLHPRPLHVPITWSGLGCNTMRWGNMKRIFKK